MSFKFRHRDESAAWDKYVSAAMASGCTVENACRFGDYLLECRRERYRHKTDRAAPEESDKRPKLELVPRVLREHEKTETDDEHAKFVASRPVPVPTIPCAACAGTGKATR